MIFPFEIIPFNKLDYKSNFLKNSENINLVIKVLRLPLLYEKLKFSHKLQDFLKLSSISIRLIRFLFTVAIFVHIVGCIWLSIGRDQIGN